jgi:hypothetical protein
MRMRSAACGVSKCGGDAVIEVLFRAGGQWWPYCRYHSRVKDRATGQFREPWPEGSVLAVRPVQL